MRELCQCQWLAVSRTGKIVAMVQFAGSYIHVKAENVDAYMAAIGVPWIARKAAAAVTPALGVDTQ